VVWPAPRSPPKRRSEARHDPDAGWPACAGSSLPWPDGPIRESFAASVALLQPRFPPASEAVDCHHRLLGSFAALCSTIPKNPDHGMHSLAPRWLGALLELDRSAQAIDE